MARSRSPSPPVACGDGAPGCLLEGLPAYVDDPPVEAVAFAWGSAEDGQLGVEEHGGGDVLAPTVVEALLGARLRGRGFGAPPLVAGSRNTLAVGRAAGGLLSWGWNARATLGRGRGAPRAAGRAPAPVAGLAGVRVVQVALGGWHALALDDAGEIWAWGGNEYWQCGGPHGGARELEAPVRAVPGLRAAAVSAGGMSSVALIARAGELWQWGEPWGDFSGAADRAPRRVDGRAGYVRVACGAFHTLALDAAGDIYAWGINDFGQLGTGTTLGATRPARVAPLEGGARAADVAAGGWHSVALDARGGVHAWGRGEHGRLGLGDAAGASRLRPAHVAALARFRVVEASAGGTHTAVVTACGRCFCWGRGSYGRLGTGTLKDHPAPVEVRLPGGHERWRVVSCAAGGRHTVALAVPTSAARERERAGEPEPQWTLELEPSGAADDEGGGFGSDTRAPGGSSDGGSTGAGGSGGSSPHAAAHLHPPPPPPGGRFSPAPGADADDAGEREEEDVSARLAARLSSSGLRDGAPPPS